MFGVFILLTGINHGFSFIICSTLINAKMVIMEHFGNGNYFLPLIQPMLCPVFNIILIRVSLDKDSEREHGSKRLRFGSGYF